MSHNPKIIFLVGRPGSGKGTQLHFLTQKTGFEVVRTGEMLRSKAKEEDLLGREVKRALDSGLLIPTPIIFSLWMPSILEFHEGGSKGIIFDGNPRKLYEAHLLEELFLMLSWGEPTLLYVDISEEESCKRLEKRGRDDDTEEYIKERLRWFKEEVLPVVDYYRNKGRIIEIDGEKSIEEVNQEIEKKLIL